MKCMHCQSHMTRGTAPMHVDRKGYHLSLEAVPAWICDQCGEPYFEEREVESVQPPDSVRRTDGPTSHGGASNSMPRDRLDDQCVGNPQPARTAGEEIAKTVRMREAAESGYPARAN